MIQTANKTNTWTQVQYIKNTEFEERKISIRGGSLLLPNTEGKIAETIIFPNHIVQ